MYRRERSGLFITLTTALIVVVMAVFTWVMWGMARQVNTITATMLEGNENFKEMVVDMRAITDHMQTMTDTIVAMNGTMRKMGGDIAKMDNSMSSMTESMTAMNGSMTAMNGSMRAMTTDMNRMTMDVGRASYAFSNPMGYMFGNGFPF